MSPGLLAVGAAGAALVAATLVDVFITIFNYDGFTFLADRFHRVMWRLIRPSSALLGKRARGAMLSLGAASMLPATIALWLGLEVVGFAMMYVPGVASGAFSLKNRLPAATGTAFYLSAGAISSLTFGDIEPLTSLYQALVVLETVIGLTTLTLALTYVLTTLGVLNHIDRLHGRVRRHAEDPERPSSVLTRHFRAPEASQLPTLLHDLTEDLDRYDEGLRRYPVVYYFHTRRIERSVPRVFSALGELIALARWGLPPGEPLTDDPSLRALSRGYVSTVDRLQRSFCGPARGKPATPLDEEAFRRVRRGAACDAGVAAFCALEAEARRSAHLPALAAGEDGDDAYRRYREWLPFSERRRVFIEEVSHSLGYELRPEDGRSPSVA